MGSVCLAVATADPGARVGYSGMARKFCFRQRWGGVRARTGSFCVFRLSPAVHPQPRYPFVIVRVLSFVVIVVVVLLIAVLLIAFF